MEWRDRNDRPVGRDRDSRRLILPSLKESKSSIRIELLVANKCHVIHNFTLCTWLRCAPSRKRGFASPDAVAQRRSLGKRCCPCLSLAPPFRTVVRWANGRCTVARAGRGFHKAPLRTEGILWIPDNVTLWMRNSLYTNLNWLVCHFVNKICIFV